MQQVRCFVTSTESPAESLTWFKELEKNLEESEVAMYRVCVYGHRASTISARIRDFLVHGPNESPTTGAELLIEADHFEADMQRSWPDSPENFETPPFGDVLSLRVLAYRTFFYAFRLKFQLRLWELVYKIQYEPGAMYLLAGQKQLESRLLAVQTVADEVLACAPVAFSTGTGVTGKWKPRVWTDGVRMLWPLRMVAFWAATRDDQKLAARGMLENIREDLGMTPNVGVFRSDRYGYFSNNGEGDD